MANQKQLEILKRGVDEWNKWRKEHPDDEIDLSEADLRWAVLREANLSWANLTMADLTLADLWKANLGGADLRMTCSTFAAP